MHLIRNIIKIVFSTWSFVILSPLVGCVWITCIDPMEVHFDEPDTTLLALDGKTLLLRKTFEIPRLAMLGGYSFFHTIILQTARGAEQQFARYMVTEYVPSRCPVVPLHHSTSAEPIGSDAIRLHIPLIMSEFERRLEAIGGLRFSYEIGCVAYPPAPPAPPAPATAPPDRPGAPPHPARATPG
jgi:hypothetical protein